MRRQLLHMWIAYKTLHIVSVHLLGIYGGWVIYSKLEQMGQIEKLMMALRAVWIWG